jgi:hypothetical protein
VGDPTDELKFPMERVVQPFACGPEIGSMPLSHRNVNTVIELLVVFFSDFEGTKKDSFGRAEDCEANGKNLDDRLSGFFRSCSATP